MQLPFAFLASIQNEPGFNNQSFTDVHAGGSQVTSVRINPHKGISINQISSAANAVKIPWSSNGYYLKERPSFTIDPLFHAGAYYVQEASSMFLEQVLLQTCDPNISIKILDLCAAPGGKSTLIQSVISSESLLVSNEVIKSRVTVLSENIAKWGAANVIVTNNDAKDFQRLPQFFDVIVVDAPCSGSGLFRKDPNAVDEWSEQNVELCSLRQQRILTDILPALKNGGILIYSTCSYSGAENEAIADCLLEAHSMESIRLSTLPEWNIIETTSDKKGAYGYRFYPDKLQGEGFFLAAFKKPGDYQESRSAATGKNKNEKLSAKESAVPAPFLNNPEAFFFIQQMEDVLAFPKQLEKDLYQVQANLYIKKAGVKMGAVIRNELIPDHALAISCATHPALPAIETNLENALQYLRKQEVSIDSDLRGWALITYQRLPLGWVKVLPNRINNYYPKEWRILNK